MFPVSARGRIKSRDLGSQSLDSDFNPQVMHPGSDFTQLYPPGISVGLCSLIRRAIALDEGIPSPFADAPSGISRYFMLGSIPYASLIRVTFL